MIPGTLAVLNVVYTNNTRIPIYKRGNNVTPAGFLNDYEVCAVTDELGAHNQIVTSRGEVGWIHSGWLKQV